MKYLNIKFANHSLLGNLELDLKNDVGTPYDTILLAGENGTGKTALLNALYSFDTNRIPDMHGIPYIGQIASLCSLDRVTPRSGENLDILDIRSVKAVCLYPVCSGIG